jgi:hypothetical protein
MSHRRILEGRVLVSAWKTPELADIREIAAQVAEDSARLAQKLLYLSVIGPTSIPRGEIRDELVGFYQSMLASAESMHIVIEGTEFQQSIKRSVIANVLLVVPARGRVFIENSIPGVIAASPASTRVELAKAAQVAGEQKLFDFARGNVNP